MNRPLTHRQTVNVFIYNDNEEILLLERVGTQAFMGELCVPGGGVELGEDILQAARREVQEEVGLKVETRDLELMGIIDRKLSVGSNPPRALDFFFKAYKWFGKEMNCEPNKHAGPFWLPVENLPINAPYVKEVLIKLNNKPSVVI